VSPTRRGRKTQALTALALTAVAAAVGAALLLRPQLADDPAAAGSPASSETAAPTDGAAPAAATSSAPYTIKSEPTFVATDAPATTSDDVDVVLTYAAFDANSRTVQANGFVAGVIENGGTCTLTLSRGNDTVRATSPAEADATTTSCGLLETTTGLAAGTWDAVLTYSSDGARGKSDSVEVTVR
jgi:hypothetical protein